LQLGWAEPRCSASCPMIRLQSSSQRNRWTKSYRHRAFVRDRRPPRATRVRSMYCTGRVCREDKGACLEGHGPVISAKGGAVACLALRQGAGAARTQRFDWRRLGSLGKWRLGRLGGGASRGPGFRSIPCFQAGQPQPAQPRNSPYIVNISIHPRVRFTR
jgi:hypothetical protein